MKKFITIIFIVSLIFNCSEKNSHGVDAVIESGDLTRMKTKRTEELASFDSITNVLEHLETVITEKNTTKRYNLVTTNIVKDTNFNSYISIQRSVETAENLLIYPEYQGVLSQVYVNLGQKVSKGQ